MAVRLSKCCTALYKGTELFMSVDLVPLKVFPPNLYVGNVQCIQQGVLNLRSTCNLCGTCEACSDMFVNVYFPNCYIDYFTWNSHTQLLLWAVNLFPC